MLLLKILVTVPFSIGLIGHVICQIGRKITTECIVNLRMIIAHKWHTNGIFQMRDRYTFPLGQILELFAWPWDDLEMR